MAKFTMDPDFAEKLYVELDTRIDKFTRQLLREMRAKAPLGKGIDYEPKYGGGGKRDPRHLRNTGHIDEADGGAGGVTFDSPHAIFVEMGHRYGGAVKKDGFVEGRHFMRDVLNAHADEIKNGSFLKKKE